MLDLVDLVIWFGFVDELGLKIMNVVIVVVFVECFFDLVFVV